MQKVFYFHREEYYTVSHTLCPVSNYKVSVQGIPDINQRLFVGVSTSSPTNLTFTVSAEFETDFMIEWVIAGGDARGSIDGYMLFMLYSFYIMSLCRVDGNLWCLWTIKGSMIFARKLMACFMTYVGEISNMQFIYNTSPSECHLYL